MFWFVMKPSLGKQNAIVTFLWHTLIHEVVFHKILLAYFTNFHPVRDGVYVINICCLCLFLGIKICWWITSVSLISCIRHVHRFMYVNTRLVVSKTGHMQKNVHILYLVETVSGAIQTCCLLDVHGSFPGFKRSVHVANHSLAPSLED
jgi:hypothetical protein